MNLTKSKLKNLIFEELEKLALTNVDGAMLAEVSDSAWDAHKLAIENIRNMSKQMSEEDSYAFLTLLKNWFNKNVLEEQWPERRRSREDLEEVYSEKQRRWACTNPDELTAAEAKEMCADVDHSKK